MKELKELAEQLEQMAKQEKDLGVKSGLMQAACMAYEKLNLITLANLTNGN
jgi:hypothetical protein